MARLKARPKRTGVDPSTKVKFRITDLILELASNSSSAFAKKVIDYVDREDFKALVSLAVDPNHYTDPSEFAADYLLASVVKKYRDFRLDINREEAAFKKWLQAEESCQRTNHFFRELCSGGSIPFPSRVGEALCLAQRKIAEILGRVDYNAIRRNCRFGPGSDLSTDGDYTSSYNKYKNPGSATPWILPVFSEIFAEDRHEDFLHECEFVKGNRLAFVPKTAVIDRSICVEPRWNIFLQLGIGEVISQRLMEHGLDLKNQDRNRELARLAHVYGLSTIDLSSASDTVSKGLVLYLLPEEWSDLIFKTRSPFASYKGKDYLLEKVSSMGNGYTFPLESLIFYSLCFAACRLKNIPECIGVFGDDLIVPKEAVPFLIELLSYAGFSVNSDKTFIDGKFFESCGKDFFEGVNVRPFFIKEEVSSVLDLIILCNQVYEYMRRLPDVAGKLKLRFVWERLVKLVPKQARLIGPMGLAGVIHAPWDMCKPTVAPHGWEGYFVDSWTAIPNRFRGNDFNGHLFSKLSDDIDTGQEFITRRSVRWRKKRTYVPTYGDFVLV
jgi:hypothetical protein